MLSFPFLMNKILKVKIQVREPPSASAALGPAGGKELALWFLAATVLEDTPLLSQDFSLSA